MFSSLNTSMLFLYYCGILNVDEELIIRRNALIKADKFNLLTGKNGEKNKNLITKCKHSKNLDALIKELKHLNSCGFLTGNHEVRSYALLSCQQNYDRLSDGYDRIAYALYSLYHTPLDVLLNKIGKFFPDDADPIYVQFGASVAFWMDFMEIPFNKTNIQFVVQHKDNSEIIINLLCQMYIANFDNAQIQANFIELREFPDVLKIEDSIMKHLKNSALTQQIFHDIFMKEKKRAKNTVSIVILIASIRATQDSSIHTSILSLIPSILTMIGPTLCPSATEESQDLRPSIKH